MEPKSTSAAHGSSYRDEHFVMDFEQRTAAVDSMEMVFTSKEYELLSLLVQHAGRIIPRQELLINIWSYGPQIRTRTLDVHIRRLRKKLGIHANRYIETIFGIGYRFQPYHSPRFASSWEPGRAA
jgi:two-component system phosphate regulon response regulator PhoB